MNQTRTVTPATSVQRRWWKECVVYQVYPRSFMDSNGDGIGDLPGITARLDYLQWLGVDVIWLCPVFRSPNDDNGYDVSDYRAIMDEFGSMADFDALLAAVHARGMKLIVDLVLNHCSDEHPWFIEARAARTSAKRDWFLWRDGREGGPPNNWESIFGGPAWKLDEGSGQYFLHIFSARQPDFNWEHAALRAALFDIVRWWLDKGVDGFRLDALSHLKKAPGLPDLPNPRGLPCVPSYAGHMNVDGVLEHVDRLCAQFAGRDVMTVGEANGVGPAQALEWVGAEHGRLSMLFQFEHLALWSPERPGALDLRALKKVLSAWQRVLHGRGWNALFIENHDVTRALSRWGDEERRRDSATALAALYFLMEGTPFIYQGQEIGMANSRFERIDDFRDVASLNAYALGRAAGEDEAALIARLAGTSRDNARTPMQWDASAQAGFSTATPWIGLNPDYRAINVAAQRDDPDSVLNFYRRLIALRRAEPVLQYGRYRLLMADDARIYAYGRSAGREGIVVIVNMSRGEAQFRHRGIRLRHAGLLLANRPVAAHADCDSVRLQAFEARVYRLGRRVRAVLPA